MKAEVTAALLAAAAIAIQHNQAAVVIEGDSVKFIFNDIVEDTDVIGLVDTGVNVDGEFSDSVVELLLSEGVEWTNWS